LIQSIVNGYIKKKKTGPLGYVFTIESESGFACTDIVKSAVDILRTKFSRPDFIYTYVRGDETYASYVIKGEDYSMGGVLQSTAVMQTSSVLSAGYYKPHPLENR
jgi:hypothetical protein